MRWISAILWYSGAFPEQRRSSVTTDEELTQLEEQIRRLKIDFDVYFGGGSKTPPLDALARVRSLMKRYAENPRMNFAQRFRANTISQRFALYSGLWDQKLKIKEEGYRRPQDAVLGIQGMRIDQEHEAAAALARSNPGSALPGKFETVLSDVESEHENVERLYNAMVAARTKAGDPMANKASFASFQEFVKRKTDQIRKDFGCHAVEYAVEYENGQVKLKAKAKIA